MAMEMCIRDRHKTRLQRDRQTGDSIKFEAFDSEAKADEKEEEIKIAREKTIPVKPMSAEEAILQMELLNHNFFVFQDAEDMEVRVVYKLSLIHIYLFGY